jgi:hypothetical protein
MQREGGVVVQPVGRKPRPLIAQCDEQGARRTGTNIYLQQFCDAPVSASKDVCCHLRTTGNLPIAKVEKSRQVKTVQTFLGSTFHDLVCLNHRLLQSTWFIGIGVARNLLAMIEGQNQKLG